MIRRGNADASGLGMVDPKMMRQDGKQEACTTSGAGNDFRWSGGHFKIPPFALLFAALWGGCDRNAVNAWYGAEEVLQGLLTEHEENTSQPQRNDMGRLLLRACDWLGSNVTLLWVLRAGRHTKDEAYRFVSGIAESTQRLLVLVTHMDKLFEERYREAGPGWRDGILQGVPHRDPRWKQQRRVLMQDLRSEVESTVRRTLQIEEGAQLPEMCFACLGGWMSRGVPDEEDEFAEPQPWPWAREELSDFFGILPQESLRRLLDTRLGVA
eukprot:s384_g17.t1